MGGTWMMLAYGLGGMRDDDGMLSFWPRRAPEDNAILRFPVTYRGQVLDVEIGLEKVEYTLREGESLLIRHETEEIWLTRENPVAARPVSWGNRRAKAQRDNLESGAAYVPSKVPES
jgi:alpha,alpha-trehalose phosphorylase